MVSAPEITCQSRKKRLARHRRDIDLHVGREEPANALEQGPWQILVKILLQGFCRGCDTQYEAQRFGRMTPEVTRQQIGFRVVGDQDGALGVK